MNGKRYSRQRELIIETLRHTNEHPTAEMLYRWLKPENPSLSLGTVYRNLNLLVEDGIITRMPFPVERYDADTRPHPHFCCDECGAVYDMDLPYDPEMDRKAAEASEHDVTGHQVTFHGVCAKCRQTARQVV